VQVHHDEGVANRIDPESCADTSSNVCADSSCEGTRCKGAAIADSHSMSFIENSAFCVSNACPERPRRVPRGEASRKAGCRKSARPV
jgi:hypothetical protein